MKPHLPLKDIKANCVNKFISIRGTVVRTSKIQPQVISLPFECKKCGNEVLEYLEDGIFKYPSKCNGKKCKFPRFKILRNRVTVIDYQEIKLQESDNDDIEAGRVPRTLNVILTNNLVDKCVPGDIVEICGLVKRKKINNFSKNDSSIYTLYIMANSVRSGKVYF